MPVWQEQLRLPWLRLRSLYPPERWILTSSIYRESMCKGFSRAQSMRKELSREQPENAINHGTWKGTNSKTHSKRGKRRLLRESGNRDTDPCSELRAERHIGRIPERER